MTSNILTMHNARINRAGSIIEYASNFSMKAGLFRSGSMSC